MSLLRENNERIEALFEKLWEKLFGPPKKSWTFAPSVCSFDGKTDCFDPAHQARESIPVDDLEATLQLLHENGVVFSVKPGSRAAKWLEQWEAPKEGIPPRPEQGCDT